MRPGLTLKRSRLLALKPVSTRCKLMSERTSKPAPISSSNETDTCATTKDLLRNDRDAELELRPLSFKVGVRSSLVARSAGNKPKMIPVKRDNPSVKPSTRKSRRGLRAVPLPPQKLAASKP